MTSKRLKTTSASDYEPLRYDGQRVDELWPDLEDVLNAIQNAPGFPLEKRLTLAEPAIGPGGQIDWYGPTAAAQPPEQLQQDYTALCAAILAQAARNPALSHEALAQALEIPDQSALSAGPAGPVLAPWGHRLRGGKLQHGDLQHQEHIAPPPPPPEPPPAPPALSQAPQLAAPPPVRPVTVVPSRPLGPWQEWALLLLGLGLLSFFLCMLPRLAGWFAALHLSCRVPHFNLPLWVLLLLGLILLALGLFWPIRRYLTARIDSRRAAGIGVSGGVLQVILTWNDRNDLDLHIVCPDEGRIYYNAPVHPDGARLTHDANINNGVITNRPVESVVWHHAAMPGLYRISVDPYTMRTGKNSPFRVTVLRNGRIILRGSGVARAGQRHGSEFKFFIEN